MTSADDVKWTSPPGKQASFCLRREREPQEAVAVLEEGVNS